MSIAFIKLLYSLPAHAKNFAQTGGGVREIISTQCLLPCHLQLPLLNLISSFKNRSFLKQIIVSERKFLTMNFSFQVILSSFKNNSLF